MKNFISNNLITIVIVLFVLGGLYQMRDRFNFPSTGNDEEPSQDGYSLFNHSAIHGIKYSGDIYDQQLASLGQYLQQVGEFKKYKAKQVAFQKENNNYTIRMQATESFIENPPGKELYPILNWVMGLKSQVLNASSIQLVLTNENWNDKREFQEKEMSDLLGKYIQKYGNLPSQPSNSENTTAENILSNWETGATNIAKATYYFEVKQNNEWRIYYNDNVAQYVEGLGNILYDGNLFTKGTPIYLSFYKEVDTLFYKNEEAYFIAVPFNEEVINSGRASKSIEAINDYLKQKYFADTRLIVVGTDMKFIPALTKTTY